jgi:hypothetical protein
MLQLTRIACKFVPPTLAVEYKRPGHEQKKVKELSIEHLIDLSPEDAIDVVDQMYPWIFTKTNATRQQFVRVFIIAKRGFFDKQKEAEEKAALEKECGAAPPLTDTDEPNLAPPLTDTDEPNLAPPLTDDLLIDDVRASVESRRSRKSSGSRGRYGDFHCARASLAISTTFDHGLLGDLALEDMGINCD